MSHISTLQQLCPLMPEFLGLGSGLTGTDVTRAQGMMPLLPGWGLDCHEDYDGTASLVISATSDDGKLPTFALHVSGGMIQSGVVVADQYSVIAQHGRVEDGVRAIAAFLRGHTASLIA